MQEVWVLKTKQNKTKNGTEAERQFCWLRLVIFSTRQTTFCRSAENLVGSPCFSLHSFSLIHPCTNVFGQLCKDQSVIGYVILALWHTHGPSVKLCVGEKKNQNLFEHDVMNLICEIKSSCMYGPAELWSMCLYDAVTPSRCNSTTVLSEITATSSC